jgi:hypothetical protein
MNFIGMIICFVFAALNMYSLLFQIKELEPALVVCGITAAFIWLFLKFLSRYINKGAQP